MPICARWWLLLVCLYINVLLKFIYNVKSIPSRYVGVLLYNG